MRGASVRNWLLLCLVNLFWAAQYPAYRVASESMGPAALNFWTFGTAVAALAPFLFRERRRTLRPSSRGAKSWVDFLLLGSFGLIPPSVLLAWGISHSSASNAAILALTIPVLMIAMGMLLLRERPAKTYLIGLGLALAGAVVISQRDLSGGSFGTPMLAGNLAIFTGCAGSAFYNTYCKRVLKSFTELEVLVYGYLVAMVLCGAISVTTERPAFYEITQWPATAWAGVAVLGAVSWGIAMVIWMWLLARLSIGQVSASVYLLPVLGVMLSVLTLKEHLTAAQVIGGLVVLLATFFSSVAPQKQGADA
jgi:drug/metabolite transporter (DMT)-like permease